MQISPMEQALSGKLMAEINGGLQCVAANITLQQELTIAQQALTQAQARIAELEDQLKAVSSSKSKLK